MGAKIYVVADFCQYLIVTTNESKARNIATFYDDWYRTDTDFITLDTWQGDSCRSRETFWRDKSVTKTDFVTDVSLGPPNFADGQKQAS